MTSVRAAPTPIVGTADASLAARRPRLEALDVARAVAMLGMLVVHTIGTHNTAPDAVLWTAYGWTAPLFVVVAGVGLSLGTRPGAATGARPRALAATRGVLLIVLGLAIAPLGDGNILHYFGLYFVVGAAATRLPTKLLVALAGLGLVGGPLALTALRRAGTIGTSVSTVDVGPDALTEPVAMLRAMTLDGAYPAIVWLGFLFTGMVLGRADLRSAALARRLFWFGSAVAAVAFTVGWWGGRRYDPEPLLWSHHWTTYGHSKALGWTVATSALSLAIIGGLLWLVPRLTGRVGRALLRPVVALGQGALTFYLVHLAYAGTVWTDIDAVLTTTSAYVVATLAFWLGFGCLARLWLRRMRRGPVEAVVHGLADLLVRPQSSWRRGESDT